MATWLTGASVPSGTEYGLLYLAALIRHFLGKSRVGYGGVDQLDRQLFPALGGLLFHHGSAAGHP